MRFPRWSTYPALALLLGMVVLAVPRRAPDPLAQGVPQPKFPRVVVIGIDGLDPDILKETIELFPDRMQNFAALVREGGLHDLGTSTPPQSPVAWSNFITGLDPGGHGIFDFIHRDPATRNPIPSTTKVAEGSSIGLPGDWQLPIGGSSESNRTGAPFWGLLADAGVPADIWRVPANFPVEKAQGLSFSGMMTPAVDSAYGQFTWYSTDPPTDWRMRKYKLQQVSLRDGKINAKLVGPPNMFKEPDQHGEHPASTLPVTILVDEESNAAAIDCGGSVVVLRPGQWSDFIRVKFSLLPLGMSDVHGIVRFYLRRIAPEFELYASPVNIDPTSPIAPVSEPSDASADLAAPPPAGIGLYYTQGMAEDVGALKAEILTVPEFMEQSQLVHDESLAMLDYAFAHYFAKADGGLMFFYFSSIDLCCHMAWDLTDEKHPHHDAKLAALDSSKWSHRAGSTWKDTVHDLYMRMDPVIGEVRKRIGADATLIVMSDHGFAPYRRKFSLNTWLLENGYLVLQSGKSKEAAGSDDEVVIGSAVDWSKTRAYGMGFNGLYLNLAGREGVDAKGETVGAPGIVKTGAEADALLAEIKAKLEALIDPKTSARVVLRCDLAKDVYHGARAAEAPDMLVGYDAGYGNSDEASVGRIPAEVLSDNLGGTFTGSHLMAPDVVHGTLLSTRKVRPGAHGLEDLTVEILARYGVPPGPGMHGHPVLE